jgi:Double zinc ribbon
VTCPQCAFDNPPAMAFCGRCGTRLASLCPSYGFTNPEGFAFCGKCGARVTGAPAPPEGSPVFPSPRSYTPKHLAEKILTSKAALEGERKQVTVLFADLKGSMELLADRDPEEARKLLDPVLECMMEAVHRYEGTVNQVMGDGIMALFGAPPRPRGSRGAGVLRRAQDAGADPPLCRAGSPRARRAGPRPGRRQLGRGRGPLRRLRSPHGLHRGGADDAPRRAHGADGHARVDPHHRRDPSSGRGLCGGGAARADRNQGPTRAGGGIRGARRWVGPHAAPSLRGAGAVPLRRPRRRDGAAPDGAGAGDRGARAGGGRGRGAGRGEVAALLRVHPLSPDPGVAGARERVGILWQGHGIPAGHRSPQVVLPDRGPGRCPHDHGKGGR